MPNPKTIKYRRVSFYLKPVLLISIVYIVYQFAFLSYLSKDGKTTGKPPAIRGVHSNQLRFYAPNEQHRYVCIYSLEEIDVRAINDDYCDCADGTDEPGTNACSNGEFYCSYQTKFKNFPQRIPSNRVNDGICDCCDGSDEWERKQLPHRLDEGTQKKLEQFQSPCPTLC